MSFLSLKTQKHTHYKETQEGQTTEKDCSNNIYEDFIAYILIFIRY